MAYEVMKVDRATVGGYTHLRTFTSKVEATKFVSGANGMTLALWSTKQYEEWHKSLMDLIK